MAFGDQGNFSVPVDGVPFRVQASSQQEAEDLVFDALEADDSLFNQRASRLGLITPEGDSSALQQIVSSVRGDAAPPPNAAAAELNQGERFLVGAGRRATEIVRGVRTTFADAIGDEETATELRELDSNEKALFDQMDKEGIGLEDLGQLVPDVAAFLLTGGVASTAAMGAVLGGTSIDNENAGDRIFGATAGAVGASIVPLTLGAKHLATNLGRSVRSFSRKVGQNRVFVTPGFGGGKGQQIVQESLDLVLDNAPGSLPHQAGRAALSRAERILDTAPNSWIKDEVLFGTIARAFKDSIVRVGQNGTRVLSPKRVVDSLDNITSRDISNAVIKPLAREIKALKSAMRALDDVPVDLTQRQVEALTSVLLNTPAKGQTLVRAIESAVTPSAKEKLLNAAIGMAEAGVRAAGQGVQSTGRAGLEAVGSQAGPESEVIGDVSEFLINRGRAVF